MVTLQEVIVESAKVENFIKFCVLGPHQKILTSGVDLTTPENIFYANMVYDAINNDYSLVNNNISQLTNSIIIDINHGNINTTLSGPTAVASLKTDDDAHAVAVRAVAERANIMGDLEIIDPKTLDDKIGEVLTELNFSSDGSKPIVINNITKYHSETTDCGISLYKRIKEDTIATRQRICLPALDLDKFKFKLNAYGIGNISLPIKTFKDLTTDMAIFINAAKRILDRLDFKKIDIPGADRQMSPVFKHYQHNALFYGPMLLAVISNTTSDSSRIDEKESRAGLSILNKLLYMFKMLGITAESCGYNYPFAYDKKYEDVQFGGGKKKRRHSAPSHLGDKPKKKSSSTKKLSKSKTKTKKSSHKKTSKKTSKRKTSRRKTSKINADKKKGSKKKSKKGSKRLVPKNKH
jgi:hypothetical protein